MKNIYYSDNSTLRIYAFLGFIGISSVLASNFITPCPCVSSSDLTTIDNIGTIIDFQSELTTTAYNVLDPTNLLYGTLSDFESELV